MKNGILGAGKLNSLVAVVLVLCIQLGLSTFVSGAVTGCLFLWLCTSRSYPKIELLIYVELGLISILLGISMGLNVLLLREARMLLIGCLLIVFLRARLTKYFDLPTFFWLLFGVLALTVTFQAASHAAGFPLVLPDNLFAIGDDKALLSNELEKAQFGGYDLRVRYSATFSEPSYLGLILTALSFMSLSVNGKTVRGYLLSSILFFIAVIAGTAYGQIGILLVTVLWKIKFKLRTFLFQPIQILLYNATQLPFGVPLSSALDFYQNLGFFGAEEDTPFQNAFLNIFVTRGYLGVPVFLLLFRSLLSREEIIFFTVAMCQNGGIFVFDKLFLISLFVLLSRRQQMFMADHRFPIYSNSPY